MPINAEKSGVDKRFRLCYTLLTRSREQLLNSVVRSTAKPQNGYFTWAKVL